MKKLQISPEIFNQNRNLAIRIISPNFGHLPIEQASKFEQKRRLTYYFFLMVLDGVSEHIIDGHKFDVNKNELLFSLPHQLQEFPAKTHGGNYYKLGFTEECLSRLPKQYSFLLNPIDKQKISLSLPTAGRVSVIFQILHSLLINIDSSSEIIIAHLNSLLTEIDNACFADSGFPIDDLDKFIKFKVIVENNLTNRLTIKSIAKELTISTDSLYQMVKLHSGYSPKEFLNNRLILEAKRLLYNSKHFSVKELSFELGFNDPNYFSRLFRKNTGKTVSAFFQDLS